jgi:hypothetical protein
MSSSDPFCELRGDILREHMDVIDAVVQATPGANRMSVVRQILAEWVDRKCHEATLIQRVRRGNGSAVEAGRNPSGVRAE